jgi:hypothetical protein
LGAGVKTRRNAPCFYWGRECQAGRMNEEGDTRSEVILVREAFTYAPT